MKFRKKPVEIEATQWFKIGDHPQDNSVPDGAPASGLTDGKVVRRTRVSHSVRRTECPECGLLLRMHGFVDTLEGGHRVCPGDWIITGVQGEHYPCKPDIFEETYEAV